MFYFPWGAVINGAVKRSIEQKLQLKLKGNTNASLYFTGTEFQSVFVSRENVNAFVLIYIYIRVLPSIYSVPTDHRSDNMFRKCGLSCHIIDDSIFSSAVTGFVTEFTNIPREFD